MAKRADPAKHESSRPDSELEPTGSDPVEMIALSEVRMFGDGSAPMLLDQAVPQWSVEPADTLDLRVSLSLEELLPDDAGEVVLIAADDVPIDLLSSAAMTGAGIAPEHVTLGGMEVTGHHYYSFENGLTVYSPVDLLILNDPSGT